MKTFGSLPSAKRGPVVLLLLIGLLTVGGCRTGGSGRNDALVRLINAAPDAEDLSIDVDGKHVWRNSSFRSSTGYGGLGEGTYQVDISAQQNGQRLTGRSYIQCQKGLAYTVVAFSRGAIAAAPVVRIFSDPREISVPPGKVRLRLINGASGLGGVDLLFNNIVGLQGIAFGARSEAILLDAGSYDMKLFAAGDADTLPSPVRVRFQPGHSYTLVAMGRRGTDLTLIAYPDGA